MVSDNNPKTAYELLLNGFKGRNQIIKALHLGETRIPLNTSQQKKLKKAIEDKDYYEIKRFVSRLNINYKTLR